MSSSYSNSNLNTNISPLSFSPDYYEASDSGWPPVMKVTVNLVGQFAEFLNISILGR